MSHKSVGSVPRAFHRPRVTHASSAQLPPRTGEALGKIETCNFWEGFAFSLSLTDFWNQFASAFLTCPFEFQAVPKAKLLTWRVWHSLSLSSVAFSQGRTNMLISTHIYIRTSAHACTHSCIHAWHDTCMTAWPDACMHVCMWMYACMHRYSTSY